METYNGWEKIGKSPIGSGGQSEVWLARSPERAKERAEALGDLERGGPTLAMAEAQYSLVRPDNPSEVGALKIFKFRENSADPVKRLAREIQILAERRPNLPKLLDSDIRNRWMVTEYFPNKTIAEHRDMFTGKSIHSLARFKELVETIASLHADGIVHRDIKAANVFIRNDGRLIPGDFGLVFSDDADRLTLSKERMGPWEHLPRWANLPTRIENPTPAIDVYLLGSLLWVMVSGEEWFYGDMYKSPDFDLEKKFPQDRAMRLINLVLSQCLGAQENLCLKNAGELSTVIDEVLSTLTKNSPILDENNNLILPCPMCGKGFYNRQEMIKPQPQRIRQVFKLLTDQRVPITDMVTEVFTCSICTNVQFFGVNQPFEALIDTFQRRVNPQPGVPPRTW
jgi:serine/threonine protein kinase